jgi:hypothetical protein
MVTRRARETAALVASIRVHKAEVAARLSERLTPPLRAGEAMPDHALTLELAGRSVQLALDRLEDLDGRHHFAKAVRAHQAREHDLVAKQELYPRAVAVRRQIDAALGRRAGSELHTFSGKTPRAVDRLKRHVERAVGRLGDPDRELPPGRPAADGPVDRRSWKRRLETPLEKLNEADERLSRLSADLDDVAHQRRLAMQRFDAVYGDALHLAEAVYRMAGLDRQAVKSLRSYVEHRRLAHDARRKREARGGRGAGALLAEGGETATTRPMSRPSYRAAAVVGGWLRKRLAFRWSRTARARGSRA